MKKLFIFLVIFLINCNVKAQEVKNLPFSDLHRRPNIHPYTFIGPQSNAMDYQQMFYLEDKYKYSSKQNSSANKQNNLRYIPPTPIYQGIRPTGHRSYFMTLP